MSTEPARGQTEAEPIRLLEAAEFDFFDGAEPPAGLGRTDTPVRLLSECVCDGADPVPVLVLRLDVRPGADPAAVAFDALAAYAALNRYEISLGGSGLTPDESLSDLSASDGAVRLGLRAAGAGAAERLARVVAAVNAADAALTSAGLARSFGEWKAALQTAA